MNTAADDRCIVENRDGDRCERSLSAGDEGFWVNPPWKSDGWTCSSCAERAYDEAHP